jgi:hypothetical protein
MTSLARSVAIAGLLVPAAASVRAQEASRFDACSRVSALTSEGIGPLRIGLSPDSLKRVCHVIGERRIREYEMMQFSVLVGADTLLVYEQRGQVFWIPVTSKVFRTTDSLGVGSPLGRLLAFDALDGGFGDGEDAYELRTPRGPNCGLVFWIDAETAMALSAMARTNSALRPGKPTGPILEALRARANTGSVASIDIRGCRR